MYAQAILLELNSMPIVPLDEMEMAPPSPPTRDVIDARLSAIAYGQKWSPLLIEFLYNSIDNHVRDLQTSKGAVAERSELN